MLFNESQTPACGAHLHTHIQCHEVRGEYFPSACPQHLFVYSLYTERAVIWISVAAVWLIHTEPTLYLFLCLCFYPLIRLRLTLCMSHTLFFLSIVYSHFDLWWNTEKKKHFSSEMEPFIKQKQIPVVTTNSLKSLKGWMESKSKRRRRERKGERKSMRVMCWLKQLFRLLFSTHTPSHTRTPRVRGQWWVVRPWLHAQLNRMGP